MRVTAVELVYEAPLLILTEPVGTVSAVTVIVSVPVLPAPSATVTVMTLDPLERLILETLQLVVPLAVPLPPTSLLHVTEVIPLVLSEALPPRLTVLLVVAWVELDVGLVMVTVGTVVSRVIESFTALDIFPAASLYHTYTVLLPSPPINVYDTSST